jgi:DNA-binding beta-propeller fold protein YncE
LAAAAYVNATLNLWNGQTGPGNSVPSPFSPSGVAVDDASGELFLASYNANDIAVVSLTTGSEVASIPVGSDPA